jgi:hypothetical protein
MNKQSVCDAIMAECGAQPVHLGPGSKEPREVLVTAYVTITSTVPDSAVSKVDLLEGCLSHVGQSLLPAYHSAGNTITESGLNALLVAVRASRQQTPPQILQTGATPLAAQHAQWIAGSKSTANTIKELIDNSFTAFHARPPAKRGPSVYPTVTITVDYQAQQIRILDDSGGMTAQELNQALQVGSTAGPTVTGMSGFGVGMKQAATWFVGTNGVWIIESSTPGSSLVEVRELNPPGPGAVAATYTVKQRPRSQADPSQPVGFTRIVLQFPADGEALLQKMYQETADPTDPRQNDENTYNPAIRLDLSYTYARFFDGAKVLVPGTNGKGPVMQTLPTKLQIDWEEIHQSGSSTRMTLGLPTDLSDDPTAPSDQRVATLPAPYSQHYTISNCYVRSSAVSQQHYWWTAAAIPVKAANLQQIPDVVTNVRVSEDYSLTHQPKGSTVKLSKAEALVHERYSRGTRAYYNDRLVCMLPAPWLHGSAPGSTTAKSILAEIEISGMERALAARAQAGHSVNRLLASNKAELNLAGTPLTLMSALERDLKKHLQTCCLIPLTTNHSATATTSTLSLLKFAEKRSVRQPLAVYPPLPGSTTPTPPTPPTPPTHPTPPTPPTSPTASGAWSLTGTTPAGETYTITATKNSAGYLFVCSVVQGNTQHQCTITTAIPGKSPADAFAKLGIALLLDFANPGATNPAIPPAIHPSVRAALESAARQL